MSILIKGVDVSSDHIQGITVFPEGFAIVEEYDMLVPIKTTKCEVAPVPTPHGRLIDANKLYKWIKAECNPYGKPTIEYEDGYKVLDIIEATSTVIEAEENEDD